MNAIIAQAIITAFSELLRLAPQLVSDVKEIFARGGEPSAGDWAVLKSKVNAKSYFDYVPTSDLPNPTATVIPPSVQERTYVPMPPPFPPTAGDATKPNV